MAACMNKSAFTDLKILGTKVVVQNGTNFY